MLASLGAALRPALAWLAPLIWVIAACVAATIAMFSWSQLAGWLAISGSCILVELRADLEKRERRLLGTRRG
jgi:p-aminobenzoyl-glutamate transporter AbgT